MHRKPKERLLIYRGLYVAALSSAYTFLLVLIFLSTWLAGPSGMIDRRPVSQSVRQEEPKNSPSRNGMGLLSNPVSADTVGSAPY